MRETQKMDENEMKTNERLKLLYPNVTEPLPLCWSSTEKNNSIGLSNSNLRVHYRGEFERAMIFTFFSPLFCIFLRTKKYFSCHD